MYDLIVIVPSRGRPGRMHDLVQQYQASCTADTLVIPVVDDDDPTKDRYPTETAHAPSRNMVEALNWGAQRALEHDPLAIGFMGDDHWPTTRGWDRRYVETLRELGTGLVYGNDMFQRANLPTQVAMTADIVRAVGYMAPPTFTHMYVDNVWREWGRKLDRIRYLDDVIIEHRHPMAGKVDWDAGYRRVNSDAIYDVDRAAYRRYLSSGGLEADVQKIRGANGQGSATASTQ